MSKNTFIKLSRNFFENALWEEERKFSRAEAFLDILQTVNYKEKTFFINEKPYTCKRGETCISMTNWGIRWGWGRFRVKTFLEFLAKNKTISLKTDNKTTHIKLLNYESYNNPVSENQQQNNNGTTTEQQQNNNGATTEQQRSNTTEERRERIERIEVEEDNKKIATTTIPFFKKIDNSANAKLIRYSEEILNKYPKVRSFSKIDALKEINIKMHNYFDRNGDLTEEDVKEYFLSHVLRLAKYCDLNSENRRFCWSPINFFKGEYYLDSEFPDREKENINYNGNATIDPMKGVNFG